MLLRLCFLSFVCAMVFACLTPPMEEPQSLIDEPSSTGLSDGSSEVDAGDSEGSVDGTSEIDAGSTDAAADGTVETDAGSADGVVDGTVEIDAGSADGNEVVDSGSSDGNEVVDSGAADGSEVVDSGSSDGSIAADAGSLDGSDDMDAGSSQSTADAGMESDAGSLVSDCVTTSETNLPGVTIEFVDVVCEWTLAEVAAMIDIPYRVVIDEEVFGVTPENQDIGPCTNPGPSGLIPMEILSGNGQQYCLCETGHCGNFPNDTVTLVPGAYDRTFQWNGKNYNGPSDTGNTPGDPFPAGTYTLSVSATGDWEAADAGAVPFEVKGTLDIKLIP